MICTSYHHQQPSSTLSMHGWQYRREQKWTVDVNPVNSEQHVYYFHLIRNEQHCIRADVRISSGGSVTIISHAHALWGCNPLTFSGDLPFLIIELSLLSHRLTYMLYMYPYASELHPKCGVTLHMPHYRKVIPRQASCYVITHIIKTLSNTDWYKGLVHPKPHCTCAHTVYLFSGLDPMTFKLFDMAEPAPQLCQHTHWNKHQSNMLHTSLCICRHCMGRETGVELSM